jgi:signal transduction histidine kinase
MVALVRGAARRTGPGDIGSALEAALLILRDGLERRGVHIEIDIQSGLPLVAGGQSEMEQVFLNLVTNAREAMPDGGRLAIVAREVDGWIGIDIRDTGVGIPKEDLPRVLEPFYTTKPHGSGLGLAICRSIVWEIGGKMTLESESGRGTLVRLILPKAPGQER